MGAVACCDEGIMQYDQKSVLVLFTRREEKKKKKKVLWEMSVEWETLLHKIAALGWRKSG